MKKKFLILLLAVVCCLALFGCQNSAADNENKENNGISDVSEDEWNAEADEIDGQAVDKYLEEHYPLDGNEVVIYYNNSGATPIVTTDEADVKALQNSVKYSEWIKYNHTQYDGIVSYYIQFNDKTTIATYDDIPYGMIGHETPGELGNLQNVEGHLRMNEEFLKTVQNMFAKYSNQ